MFLTTLFSILLKSTCCIKYFKNHFAKSHGSLQSPTVFAPLPAPFSPRHQLQWLPPTSRAMGRTPGRRLGYELEAVLLSHTPRLALHPGLGNLVTKTRVSTQKKTRQLQTIVQTTRNQAGIFGDNPYLQMSVLIPMFSPINFLIKLQV